MRAKACKSVLRIVTLGRQVSRWIALASKRIDANYLEGIIKIRGAAWPSGKARVCKTLIPGSIPGAAFELVGG